MARRNVLVASVVLTCAAVVSAVGPAASAVQVPAAAGTPCSTAQPIDIASLAFQPPAVHAGQSSVATAVVVNCTNVAQQTSAQWTGRFVSSTTSGIPAGCPVIDPLLLSLSLPPHGAASSSVGYTVPGSCTANGLIVTVEILQQGKIVAQRSAELVID